MNRPDYSTLVQDFKYDAGTKTATFTFTQAIAADKLLVFIDRDAVADAAGTLLAADYSFRFDVLPGDTNQNGTVGVSDVLPLRNGLGASIGSPNYSIFADLNGNGVISVSDVLPLRNNLGRSLPPEEPVPAPASTPVPEPIVLPAAIDEVLASGDEFRGVRPDDALEAIDFDRTLIEPLDWDFIPRRRSKSVFVA